MTVSSISGIVLRMKQTGSGSMALKDLWFERDPSPTASSNVANLERRVALQKAALEQAERDLDAARERRERVDEFFARSGALDPPPANAGQPTAEDVAAFVLRAGRRARGEIAMVDIPINDRIINQRVDDPSAVAAAILAAAAKARSKT